MFTLGVVLTSWSGILLTVLGTNRDSKLFSKKRYDVLLIVSVSVFIIGQTFTVLFR